MKRKKEHSNQEDKVDEIAPSCKAVKIGGRYCKQHPQNKVVI